MSKRYEALYIHQGFCDGFWDSELDRYLNDDEIVELLNTKQGFNNVWIKKYEEVKSENQQLKDRVNYLENILRKNNLGGFK